MSIDSFMQGQRWVSNTESELGLGIVVAMGNRRVELNYPAAGEYRIYATDNAPLSRVAYQVGQNISDESGKTFAVDEILEANGCLIYSGIDDEGEARVLPERELNSFVQFSKPQDRLFAGQIDKNKAFDLRYDTLTHAGRLQQSPIRGLLGGRIQLLPHQLYIASEVSRRFAPRVLLADEVGLGKTIEAGLILHQQLYTGRADRVLIIVPDSLLHQWLVEMLRRFNLMFTILDEPRCHELEGDEDPDETDSEASEENRTAALDNPFESSQLILCTLSFLVENPQRQVQAQQADWDLMIVDEAHHLQWSEQHSSPEYQCVELLAKQSKGLLLLTATPEQLGVESHFARLRLLDPDRYFDLKSFVKEEQKHQAVNKLVQVLLKNDVKETLTQDQNLAQQLTDYLGQETTESLLLAVANEEDGELESALEQAIGQLLDQHGTGRVLFRNTRNSVDGFPDRQFHGHPLPAPARFDQSNESLTIGQLLLPELLLGELWIAEDPRVRWLEEFLKQLKEKKVLVICALAETAIQLEEHLRLRGGIRSAVFHEGLSLVVRDRAAAYFADEEEGAQVLICSEIGSEGRNFQFSHHLVLFDLPLNPDLLEQRIGRLDRIGQNNTVQIHAPYIEGSAQAVLLDWYHKGLNAFEHTSPVGQSVFLFFEQDLLSCLSTPESDDAFEELLGRTKVKAEESTLALKQGRDALLAMSSFNQQRALEIVDDMVEAEQRKVLSAYMERLFDQFGVNQEHHSKNSLVLHPGDHMLVHSFPSLPEDGMTATFQRDLALSREDMHYLSWEHPMVTGAMDMVVNGEFGNTAFCAIKLQPLIPGTVLLECIFTLSGIAPGKLQLERFLPLSTLRILVDQKGKDLSEILSKKHIDNLSQHVSARNAQELVRHTRAKIVVMLEHANKLADQNKEQLIQAAVEEMQEIQQKELSRLEALAEANPNIREEEIQHQRDLSVNLGQYLNKSQVRLDSVRVVMVAK